MESSEVPRAAAAAVEVAVSQGLDVDGAVVLHSSNRLTLRLTPGDVLARVTPADQRRDQLVELERARRLADAGCPVGAAEPSVAPRVHERGGFAVTLWAYHEVVTPEVAPAAYAGALRRLHAGMRTVALATPRFTDRIAEAQAAADDPDLSPELADDDRALLGTTLRRLRRSVEAHRTQEQLLHGEPHPGNVLGTRSGPLFVDLETCCRGPVEVDVGHAPVPVSGHYPDLDHDLLDDCRELVLAMVAAWRWRLGDEFPDRRAWGRQLLRTLRAGPPWSTPGALTHEADQP